MIANSPFETKLNDAHFKIIGEVADAMQLPCYVIGGFVRDLILGKESKKYTPGNEQKYLDHW